jgi:hypothetical protein
MNNDMGYEWKVCWPDFITGNNKNHENLNQGS